MHQIEYREAKEICDVRLLKYAVMKALEKHLDNRFDMAVFVNLLNVLYNLDVSDVRVYFTPKIPIPYTIPGACSVNEQRDIDNSYDAGNP